jgi:hypothetical protein
VGVAAADLDERRGSDLVVTNTAFNTISHRIPHQTSSPTTYPAPLTGGYRDADFDRDGFLTSRSAAIRQSVALFFNRGNGTFGTRLEFPQSRQPFRHDLTVMDGRISRWRRFTATRFRSVE